MDYAAILKSDPHVREFRPSSLQAPEVDWDNFQEDSSDAQFLLGVLQKFVEKFLVIDDFPEHGSRRQWMRDLEAQHGSGMTYFLQGNALRKNSFQQLTQDNFWDLFLATLKERSRLLIQPRVIRLKVQRSFLENYDSLSMERKIKFVTQLQHQIWEILQLLSDSKKG